MLLTREEMSLDFGGHRLDPAADREILAWIMNQFLYGEVTGIQIGQWLYDAPDLSAARFLAKQAIEELQHVGNMVSIMGMLELTPQPAHPVVRMLATGMMGGSWAEHVATEMALGEGFVLMAFYAVIDTLDHPESVAILERAVRQEESHVDFGECQTMALIAGDEALRKRLLGLSLVWMWGVRRLAGFMQSRLPDHPVLERLPDFLALCLQCAETRLLRMGVLEQPLSELSSASRAALVASAYAHKGGESTLRLLTSPARLLPFVGKRRRLTDTYLNDPVVREPG
ncbi:MAG: ferritin-like domain-containing protein [Myxococcales bacterium]|nr:ferritin-like domain-containing protein [Myxococcales bacterium]